MIYQKEDLILDRWAMMMLMVGEFHDGVEWGGKKFHHTTQNSKQFKTYDLFISGIFHLIFSDRGWLWVTETMESETTDKGGLLDSIYLIYIST